MICNKVSSMRYEQDSNNLCLQYLWAKMILNYNKTACDVGDDTKQQHAYTWHPEGFEI